MQRTLAWATTIVVVAAVVALGATMLIGGATASSEAPPAAAQPAPTAAAPPTPVAAAEPTLAPSPPPSAEPRSVTTASSTVGVSSARLADVEVERPPAPVALDIPAIGVDAAPVDPVGIMPDDSMEIPTDVRRIGWYEYGPEPGAPEGSSVLTAHVDDRTQGRGVFYHLDALDAGATVEVTMDDGSVRTFEVSETRQVPKVDLPTGDLFRREGEPVLALITCGGDFDASSRHYRDNIVVLATPAG